MIFGLFLHFLEVFFVNLDLNPLGLKKLLRAPLKAYKTIYTLLKVLKPVFTPIKTGENGLYPPASGCL